MSVIDVYAHNNNITPKEALRLNAAALRQEKGESNAMHTKKTNSVRAPVNAPQKYTKKAIHAIFCGMGSPVSYYPFRNRKGDVVTYEVHIGSGKDKQILPMTPVGDMFIMKNIPSPRPIYNLDRIDESDQIIVVEGPKDCETLGEYGFLATTSLNGAGNAHHSDWSPLSSKGIVMMPDRDEKGAEYAMSVQALNKQSAFRTVNPDHYGIDKSGADITDMVNMLKDEGQDFDSIRSVIQSLINSARDRSDVSDYLDYIEERTSSSFKPITTPFAVLNQQAFGESGIEAGSVVLLGGSPGSGKTWFALQMIQHFNRSGVKSESLFMESSRRMYTQRVLGVVSGNPDVMSTKYMGSLTQDEKRSLMMHYSDEANEILKTITTKEKGQKIDYDYVFNWASKAVMNGTEVLIIDPITYANNSDKPWMADQEITKKLAELMEQFGRRCFIITHMRKEVKKTDSVLDQFAGGKGFVRFATHALLLSRDNDHGTVLDEKGIELDSAWNKSINIAKTRDAIGEHETIAYTYSKRTLRFTERGLIPQKG